MGRLLTTILMFVLWSCHQEEITSVPAIEHASIAKVPDSAIAGEPIEFKFDIKGDGIPLLMIEHNMGPVLLKPEVDDTSFVYRLDSVITKRSGSFEWKLVFDKSVLFSGNFEINAKISHVKAIETYFGPRSIRAGGDDFSMLFVVPTDIYDNTLPDGTLVSINRQMDFRKEQIKLPIRNGYVWHNLFSSNYMGRMLVSAGVGPINGKELTSMISPSNSTDFKIEFERVHDYADGNQVVQFETDVIKDRFGNVVADGTLVNFMVVDQNGGRLYTAASTLAGVATGKLLHPTEASEWLVTAYITGESKSNDLPLSFVTAVRDFEVRFSGGNRKIEVGPLQGFMDQLVPDGLLIDLKLYDSTGVLLDTKTSNSNKGRGTFELFERFYANGSYKITIMAAGILKEYELDLE